MFCGGTAIGKRGCVGHQICTHNVAPQPTAVHPPTSAVLRSSRRSEEYLGKRSSCFRSFPGVAELAKLAELAPSLSTNRKSLLF